MCTQNQWGLRKLLLLLAVLILSTGAEACYAQDKHDEIKALLKERRDLLSEVATAMTKAFIERRVDWQVLVQAERDSLKADLDWFDRTDDRIQAIDKHKKVADKVLVIVEALEKVGKVGRTDVLQVRAYVLEVQIELLKEKRKAK